MIISVDNKISHFHSTAQKVFQFHAYRPPLHVTIYREKQYALLDDSSIDMTTETVTSEIL